MDDRQDVRAVVPRGQNDAAVWRLQVSLVVVVVETVQTVHTIRNKGDTVAFKEELRHHLTAVQRVAGCLCHQDGVLHTALDMNKVRAFITWAYF